MTRAPTNIGASVRARLLKLAKERREDFQLLLSRYANERLLHRLSVSAHASQFILKGATLFTLWTGRPHRATRDLDLLGFGDPGQARLRAVFEDILRTDVGDDGVAFDVASLEVGPIREGQEYSGVRLLLRATIVSSVVRLQVDVGFGDAITPGPENSTRIHYARFLAEGDSPTQRPSSSFEPSAPAAIGTTTGAFTSRTSMRAITRWPELLDHVRSRRTAPAGEPRGVALAKPRPDAA